MVSPSKILSASPAYRRQALIKGGDKSSPFSLSKAGKMGIKMDPFPQGERVIEAFNL
jgi:hypothetical protein